MAFDPLKLLDSLEPGVRRAFLESIADIKSTAQLRTIVGALERGDIEAAIFALKLRPEFFGPLDEALRAAYLQGGVAALAALPLVPRTGGPIVVRFDMRNPRAENWVRQSSSRLITEVIEDTKEAARGLLRTGLADGRNPRNVALDLVGRIDRTTGRRTGGVIGLHSKQIGYVENARAELSNPSRMEAYLQRKARDRRFDRTVMRAIREGRPLPADQITTLTNRYADNLLRLRGETIARTELLQSLHNAQDEGLRQLVDGKYVRADQITAKWDASEDSATRDSHRAMDGQTSVGGLFTTGAGYKMRYPGDRALGAPAEEIINCRCRKVIDIDYLADL